MRNLGKHLEVYKEGWGCPGRCGSVGWTSSCKVKGPQFDSGQDTCLGCGFGPWSGHMQGATDEGFSLTLMFLSLPLPLSKNKYIFF